MRNLSRELVLKLDGSPLAIEQASADLSMQGPLASPALRQYLLRLQDEYARLMSIEPDQFECYYNKEDKSIIGTFNLLETALRKHSTDAIKVLTLCSFYGRNVIPLAMLATHVWQNEDLMIDLAPSVRHSLRTTQPPGIFQWLAQLSEESLKKAVMSLYKFSCIKVRFSNDSIISFSIQNAIHRWCQGVLPLVHKEEWSVLAAFTISQSIGLGEVSTPQRAYLPILRSSDRSLFSDSRFIRIQAPDGDLCGKVWSISLCFARFYHLHKAFKDARVAIERAINYEILITGDSWLKNLPSLKRFQALATYTRDDGDLLKAAEIFVSLLSACKSVVGLYDSFTLELASQSRSLHYRISRDNQLTHQVSQAASREKHGGRTVPDTEIIIGPPQYEDEEETDEQYRLRAQVEGFRQEFGDYDNETMLLMEQLGALYIRDQRWVKAKLQFETIWKQYNPIYGRNSSFRARALNSFFNFIKSCEMAGYQLDPLEKWCPEFSTWARAESRVLLQEGNHDAAEELDRRTLEAIEKVLGKKHPDTLRSMNNLAVVLDDQGKCDEAEAMHREVLQLREEVLGKKHPDTLWSMNELVIVLNHQSKYDEAEAMQREALQLREEVLGKKHPDTLWSMNSLAIMLDDQGKCDEAEAMHREALQLREEVLGKKHLDTLWSMNNLAVVLGHQSKYDEAEAMYREALQLREEVLGKKHPDTLWSMNNLAIMLDDQGKCDEAKAMQQEALQLREEVLGKKHPDTLWSMNNLAVVLGHQSKYDEAEAMHREALQLREEVLGKKHPDTLQSMNNLAVVLGHQSKYDEAEAMHREALQLREEVLGKKHLNTLQSMNNLTMVLDHQSKYDEAEAMQREALQLREEVLGKKHPDTLWSMNNLAIMLDDQGKCDEADAMQQEALQLREEVLGKKHPDTLWSMNSLAIMLDDQGKCDEAEAMQREALQLREEVLGKKHPDTLWSMNNLAVVLDHQGKYDEAEAMHREALQLREEVLGKKHPNMLVSMNNLALVLNHQSKYDEAEAMHREALQLRGEVLGKKHPDTLWSMNNLAVVLDHQGKYDEAEAIQREALQLKEEALDNPSEQVSH